MIAVLIAVATSFLVCVLSTPFLIRALQRRNIGQAIRDDGPVAHPHEAKAGTPTMGGIALIAAAFVGYLAAHIRTEAIKFADTALTMWFLIIGMALIAMCFNLMQEEVIAKMRKCGAALGCIKPDAE